MATICLAPARKARSPQGFQNLWKGANGLEISAVSRRQEWSFRRTREVWRAHCARPPIASGPSARTVQGDEMRTDIDVDMIHIAVCHDSTVMVMGNEPADDLALASGNAEVDCLSGGMA